MSLVPYNNKRNNSPQRSIVIVNRNEKSLKRHFTKLLSLLVAISVLGSNFLKIQYQSRIVQNQQMKVFILKYLARIFLNIYILTAKIGNAIGVEKFSQIFFVSSAWVATRFKAKHRKTLLKNKNWRGLLPDTENMQLMMTSYASAEIMTSTNETYMTLSSFSPHQTVQILTTLKNIANATTNGDLQKHIFIFDNHINSRYQFILTKLIKDCIARVISILHVLSYKVVRDIVIKKKHTINVNQLPGAQSLTLQTINN